MSARIVTGSYLVSIGYCFADVGIEAYKLKQRNYLNEKTNAPMTMTQLVVERSVFQALASVIVPFAVIHTTVDVGKKAFKRIGRFQKWGPSLLGLSIIPLLPVYLDEVCAHCGCVSLFEIRQCLCMCVHCICTDTYVCMYV